MPFTTLVGGLELVIPTNGTKNWGTTLKNSTWQKINDHQHTGGGDGAKLNKASLNLNIVDQDILALNYGKAQAATLTPVGTTENMDMNLGLKQIFDLSSATGDVTLTILNPILGADYRIKVLQGGTLRAVIWPANVKWPGGEEPTSAMLINSTGVIWLDYDGTDFLGKFDLDYS